jgi:hypothetical protein
MSDPKSHFLAGIGRAAEAVSGNTPTQSHLGPTCDQRDRNHMWLTTAHGHDICVECKLTRPTPPAALDCEVRVRAYYNTKAWPDELWAMGFPEAIAFAKHFEESAKNDAMTLAYERWKEIKRLERELAEARRALKIARLHAPSIRLAPERRHTIAVLDAALAAQAKEPSDG